MISTILKVLERGLQAMRMSSRMFLVGVLVFVFPLLFFWVTQSFFNTSADNIQTAEKLRVGMVHDALSGMIANHVTDHDVLNNVIRSIAEKNSDYEKIRVYIETETGFFVIAALHDDVVGTINQDTERLSQLGFSETLDFQLVPSLFGGVRTWEAYTRVRGENEVYYIFTENNLSQIDNTMAFRRQQSYFGFTAIFLFLIGLAYWLHRQTFWERKHNILVQKLEERDLFFNMVAHEFRSPLTAIKGYASFLQESKNLSGDEKRFTANIYKSAERMVVLVSDFLEISRIQSGKLKIEKEELDLRETLVQVTENLQVLAKEKGLKLLYVKGPQPVYFFTDPDRITQVLTNIITNSIKYTENGTVELECTQIPGEVSIRIKDTGMGISADDQQKLFAPFTRVGGVDSTSIKGTGLGMWITKQLVELLGGTIGVESIKGVGTHVVMNFRTKLQ